MKKLRYIIIAFLSLGLFSCSDYLEHNFNDQMTIEEVFSKRPTTERFLAGLYGYIPEEINAYDQSLSLALMMLIFLGKRWTMNWSIVEVTISRQQE